MAQTKICDTFVVNELLAFLQNKLDVMDELSLEQICISSYKEDEILDAKKMLSETAKTHVRLGTRTRDGRGKRDLQDIFRVFKETEPDDVPTFVARNLCKLPPVTFDHIDVTVLLKDITSLKTELSILSKKLEASERTTTELSHEVALLRNANAVSVVPPTPLRNVNTRRGGALQFSPVSKNDSVTNSDPLAQCNDPPLQSVTDTATSQAGKSQTTSLQQKKTYANVSNSRNPCPSSRPTVARVVADVKTKKQETSTGVDVEIDKDGFILVGKTKSRPRLNRNRRGTGPASDEIRAAPPTMLLYISRLDNETSGAKILEYITRKSRSKIGTDGKALKLQRLESSRTTNFKSYILQIPAAHKSVFLSPDFWPEGVVYRKYREIRPKVPATSV